jgi:hypothetical protein
MCRAYQMSETGLSHWKDLTMRPANMRVEAGARGVNTFGCPGRITNARVGLCHEQTALRAAAELAVSCGLDEDATATKHFNKGRYQQVIARYRETSPPSPRGRGAGSPAHARSRHLPRRRHPSRP